MSEKPKVGQVWQARKSLTKYKVIDVSEDGQWVRLMVIIYPDAPPGFETLDRAASTLLLHYECDLLENS